MHQPQFAKRTCRPRDHVAAAGQLYPTAWRYIDQFRADRGTHGLPTWPQWCFVPIGATQAVVAQDAGIDGRMLGAMYPERIADAARLAALAAWRVTQGIYRFDPAVYEAVCRTPVTGDIPHDVLYRLPEWCIYVETPGLQWLGSPMHGVWAHLEHDVHTSRPELRLLADSDAALAPMALHLGPWPLSESIDRAVATAATQSRAHHGPDISGRAPGISALLAGNIEPIVSLLLYICSQAGEIGDGIKRPGNPEPKRTKRGWKLFAAEKANTWDVGLRMGAALRRAYQAEQTGQAGEASSPRPHIRRAHWHGYWLGPKKLADGSDAPAIARRFDLRWQPPIAVGVDGDVELPAVIRPVR